MLYEVITLLASKGVPFTVAQTLRYNSVVLGLRARLPTFGDLYSFSTCQRLEPSSHAWLEDPAVAGSGVIFHTAVHMFDAIRFIRITSYNVCYTKLLRIQCLS